MITHVKQIEAVFEVEAIEIGPLRLHPEYLGEGRYSPEILNLLLLLVIEKYLLPIVLNVVARESMLTILLGRQLVHHRVLR